MPTRKVDSTRKRTWIGLCLIASGLTILMAGAARSEEFGHFDLREAKGLPSVPPVGPGVPASQADWEQAMRHAVGAVNLLNELGPLVRSDPALRPYRELKETISLAQAASRAALQALALRDPIEAEAALGHLARSIARASKIVAENPDLSGITALKVGLDEIGAFAGMALDSLRSASEKAGGRPANAGAAGISKAQDPAEEELKSILEREIDRLWIKLGPYYVTRIEKWTDYDPKLDRWYGGISVYFPSSDKLDEAVRDGVLVYETPEGWPIDYDIVPLERRRNP